MKRAMIQTACVVLFLCDGAFLGSAHAQAVGDFRTHQTGNWSDTTTWERFDGAVWVTPAPSVPTGSESDSVRTGHTVTVDIGVANITGTIINQGVITIGAGTLSFSTGTYEHAQNGGTIPTATWGIGSTCLITGVVGNAPGNGNQNFYNVTWNSPAQTGNVNMGWNGITIGGNITVTATGTGRWQLCAPAVGASATVTITGDVIQTGGGLTTNGTGNGTTTIVIHQSGNINVTGGNFAISRGTQGGTGTSTWFLDGGNLSLANATTQNSNTTPAGAKFEFAKAATQTLTLTAVTFGAGGLPIQVDSGATLETGTNVIRGGGNFTLLSGATLATGHQGGIDSTLSNTGAKTLSPGATYVFDGSTPQATGSLLPVQVNGLTVNNSAGVTLTHSATVNGVLTLSNGSLTASGDTLAIGAAGSVARTSGFVTGTLAKNVAAGTNVPVDFEIGSGANYTPVNLRFATVTSGGDIIASTTGGDHPNLAASTIDPAKSVNRYWTLSNNGVAFDTYSAAFNFVAGDVDAGARPGTFRAEEYNGTTWTPLSVNARTTTSTSITGVAGFSDFAVGQPVANTIVSNGTGGGDWASPTTWVGGVKPGPVDSAVIAGTDSVSFTAADSCSGFSVQSGGKLTLAASLGVINATVSGSLINNTGGVLARTGTVTFAGGGVYQHNQNAGTVPASTWAAGSTCLVTGTAGTSAPSGLNQSFFNFTWNSPGQTGNLNLNANLTTVNGDLTVLNTGGAANQLRLGSVALTANVGGNVNVNGATAFLTTTGSAGAFVVTVNVGGNLNLSAGTLGLVQASSTGQWNISGNFTMTGGVLQKGSGTGTISFVGGKHHLLSITGGTQNTASSNGPGGYVVAAGDTLDVGSTVILGGTASPFTVNAGATLFTAHPNGFNGNLTTTGAKTLDPGASYGFTGSAPQATGTLLPLAVNGLAIDNASGVALTQTTTVNGTLTLANGVLTAASDTLAISATGAVSRINGFVAGSLRKNVETGPGVSRTFEIGSGTSYTPVNINFPNVATAGDLVARTTGTEHPNIAGSGIDSAKSVNRFWTLANNGIGFDNYDAVFNFVPGDLDAGATPANFIAEEYNGTTWSPLTVGVKTATSTQVAGVAGFSDFALGDAPTVPPTAVMSNGTGGGDWESGTTWAGGVKPRGVDSVVILGTDSLNLAVNDSCAALTIMPGGRLSLAATLGVVNATTDGRLISNTGGSLLATGAVTFGSGGVYEHNQNAGTIPTATWGTGSTCLITGVVGNAPANGNQNFSNVMWNSPAQTGSVNMGWNGITIGGTITVVSTGAGRWQMCAPAVGTGATVTIIGDLIQTAGNFTTNGTGNGTTTIVINHAGNIHVTGGNFAISRGSQGGTGTTTWRLANGNLTLANATTQNSNPAGAKFEFAKAGRQTLSLTAVTFAGGGFPVQVDSGATLDAGVSVIGGNGTFTLNAGATLASGHPGGIDSTVATTGTKTFSPGANYVFNGASRQATGASLSATVNKLSVGNDSSVTLTRGLTVNDTLLVSEGHLILSGDTVTLGPSGYLSETPGHTVTGASGVITATRTLTAPNGAVNIAGLGVKIGSAADLGSTVIARGHVVQTAGSGSIARYFDITPTTNTGLNATFEFSYDTSEAANPADTALALFRSTDGGGTWSAEGGTFDRDAHTLTLSGVGAFSRWTAAPANVLNVANQQLAPFEFSLKQNYPNPFNPTTTILFSVAKSGPAVLEVYNILGEKVATLFDAVAEAGKLHTVQFNGQHLASGVYFYRLQSGGRSDLKKLVLIK